MFFMLSVIIAKWICSWKNVGLRLQILQMFTVWHCWAIAGVGNGWVNFLLSVFPLSTLLHCMPLYLTVGILCSLRLFMSLFTCPFSLRVCSLSEFCSCLSLPSSSGAAPWLHVHSLRRHSISQASALISGPSVLARWWHLSTVTPLPLITIHSLSWQTLINAVFLKNLE